MAKINIITSGIRAKFNNKVIGTTTIKVVPDRGFDECCYINYAFGDTATDDYEKNDIYGGHIFKRELVTDTIVFWLERNGVDLAFTSTFGTLYDFGDVPNQPDLSGVQVDWKKVLVDQGEGNYRVKAVLTFASGNQTIYSNTFILKQFSWRLANKTVRFDAEHNSCFRRLDIDFTGTNWVDQVRVAGIFGYKQTPIEQVTYIDGYLNQKTTQIKNKTNYTFKSLMIPECISIQLTDRIFLASSIKVNDYNANNSSYDYINFPIFPDKSNETKYFAKSRKMKLEYVFTDKKDDNESLNC